MYVQNVNQAHKAHNNEKATESIEECLNSLLPKQVNITTNFVKFSSQLKTLGVVQIKPKCTRESNRMI